jgi:hypothetical protein
MRACLVVLAILIILATPRPASSQGNATPELAARQYFALMQKADWNKVAESMYPEALEQLSTFFQALATAEGAGELMTMFFDVGSEQEFRALSTAEVFARMMGNMASTSPEMMQAMTSMRGEVIGAVLDGPDSAHVVYRMHMAMDNVTLSQVQVMSFRRSGDRWLGLLTGDIQGMIDSLSPVLDTRR